jgi:hypothetical protein
MRALNVLALLLIVVGAINWGLIGFFGWNLVDTIFAGSAAWARIAYAIIGLAGLWGLSFFGKVNCLCGHHKKE